MHGLSHGSDKAQGGDEHGARWGTLRPDESGVHEPKLCMSSNAERGDESGGHCGTGRVMSMRVHQAKRIHEHQR